MKNKTISIMRSLIKRIQEDDLSAGASKLAFFLLLSIFPLLIFLVEMLRRIEYTNPEMIFMITEFFPQEIAVLFEYIITDISNVTVPSSIISITLIATLWSASKGIMAVIGALNIAYREKETRSFFYLRGISVLYTLALLIIMVVSFTLIVLGQKLFDIFTSFFPIILDFKLLIDTGRYLLSVFAIYLFFMLLYNVTPNRKISFKDTTFGSIFATVSFVLLSSAFSIYVNNASSFSYMYGSLTSSIMLLMWLYSTSLIIMIGGELNAVVKAYEED